MKLFSLEEPSYRVPDSRAVGGSYNLWWVYLGFLGLASSYGWVPAWLVVGLTLCLCLAVSLDRAPMSKKVSLSALPHQAFAYVGLGVRLLMELSPDLFIAFVVYLTLRPVLMLLHAWGGNSFWPVFGFLFVAQSVLFIWYVFGIVFRWTDRSLWSFESNVRKANLRSKTGALRHVVWSFALAQVGNSARAGTQVAILTVFEATTAALGLERHLLDALPRPVTALFVVAGLIGWLLLAGRTFRRAEYFYYKVHRTMHENQTLYNALHRIHHLASYPTPLDSGTEGPAEFALTAPGFSMFFVVPDWMFCLFSIKGTASLFWAHLSTDWGGAGFHFHVEHHRSPTVNYGLATPHFDRRFGTATQRWIGLKEEHFLPSMVPHEQ